eukprot:gnl/Chilomastix_caulleri/102.p1 GENE.gnl/Chilomastix_caulleri/102~~gnl/Chilomastix_caulleri/102.p1  ORF type:complete len:144 (+),score=32.28 gnl/Chilomastix_caulleri/102:76-507(+)
MAATPKFTIRTRKFISNKLFLRKQMVVDVFHTGIPSISKMSLRDKIAAKFHVKDPKNIIVYGMRTKYGGGQSTGFALIYDNMAALKRFEPYYRQVRFDLAPAKERTSRKDRKTERSKLTKRFGTLRRLEKRRAMKQRKQEEAE